MNEANSQAIRSRGPNLYRDPDGRWRDNGRFACGDGWTALLLDLTDRLEAILVTMPADERPYVQQSKQKFGALRWYMSACTEEIDAAVSDAEMKSSKTCETCGALGTIRNRNNWLRCVCARCWEAWGKK